MAVLAVNALIAFWLIAARRLPRLHDTFQYYAFQHFVLSNAAEGGGPPLWAPQLTQGTATNWHLLWQGGWLPWALSLMGSLLKGANFLPIFHLSLLVDETLLLIGLWMLGGRLYRSPAARAFVAMAGTMSALWVSQIWFNFHALYALPLILEGLHAFLDSGRRRWLLLSAGLLAAQCLGNLPYQPVCLVFVIACWIGAGSVAGRFRHLAALRPRRHDVWVVAAMAAPLLLLAGLVLPQVDQITLAVPGRDASGRATAESFLTYGGSLSPMRYLQIVSGIAPHLDYTLFTGGLVAVFAVLAAVLSPGRRTLHLAATFVILVSFSTGLLGIAAPAAFEAFPGMTYFRHVGLTAPFARLLLVLLAGVGVDTALRGRWHPAAARRLAALCVLGAGALAALLAADPYRREQLVHVLLADDTSATRAPVEPAWHLAAAAAGLALTAALILAWPALQRRRAAGLVLVSLNAIILLGWKVMNLAEATLPLDDRAYALQRLERPPFRPRRSADPNHSERYLAMAVPVFRYTGGPEAAQGATHWTSDPYFDLDLPASCFATTDWSRPMDELLRAYAGSEFRDSSRPLRTQRDYRLQLPLDRPGVSALAGVSLDRIQFFRDAVRVSPRQAADILSKPGDAQTLWILSDRDEPDLSPRPSRLDLPYTAEKFDANRLTVRVRAPPGGAWLYLADAWHPSWTAAVNGTPVTVERACLAYKAVRLDAGDALVEFRFVSPLRSACYVGLGLLSIAGLIGLALLTIRECRGQSKSPGDPLPAQPARDPQAAIALGAVAIILIVARDAPLWMIAAEAAFAWGTSRLAFRFTQSASAAFVGAVAAAAYSARGDAVAIAAVPLAIDLLLVAHPGAAAAAALLLAAQSFLSPAPLLGGISATAAMAVARAVGAQRQHATPALAVAIAAGVAAQAAHGWGPATGTSRPLDAFVGVAPGDGASFFVGFIVPALILIAGRTRPRPIAWGAGAVVFTTILVACASPDPVAHVAPVIRLGAVLAAAIGVDDLRRRAAPYNVVRAGAVMGVVFAATLGMLAANMTTGSADAALGVLRTLAAAPPRVEAARLFAASCLGAAAAAAVLGIALTGRRAVPLAVALLLVVLPLDAFGWSSRMRWLASPQPPHRLHNQSALPHEKRPWQHQRPQIVRHLQPDNHDQDRPPRQHPGPQRLAAVPEPRQVPPRHGNEP